MFNCFNYFNGLRIGYIVIILFTAKAEDSANVPIIDDKRSNDNCGFHTETENEKADTLRNANGKQPRINDRKGYK